tara:strand:- start:10789 stop:11289 length:501 start_codon:yes stop_codon:yes gene_type:complete
MKKTTSTEHAGRTPGSGLEKLQVPTPRILESLVGNLMIDSEERGWDLLEIGRRFQDLIDLGHSQRSVLNAVGEQKPRIKRALVLSNAPSEVIDLYKSGACKNTTSLLCLAQVYRYDPTLFKQLCKKAKDGALSSVEAMTAAQASLSWHRATAKRMDKVPYKPRVQL